MDPAPPLADTPAWEPATIHDGWTEIARLAQFDEVELIDALSDLIDSDILDEPGVPLSTALVVFVAIWGHTLALRPQIVRSLQLPFEHLEARAEREGVSEVLDGVRDLCPYLREVIADDLDWTHHAIPGEDAPRS